MTTIEQSSRRDQKRLRKQCLQRDGYQCVYSGWFDRHSVKEKRVLLPQGARWGNTECAHIIPFALGSFDDKDSVETQNKALIWGTLHRYFPALQGKIDANSINQPGNAVTLANAVHSVFGDFELMFRPRENAPVCLISFASCIHLQNINPIFRTRTTQRWYRDMGWSRSRALL